jgi:hypothetical protein
MNKFLLLNIKNNVKSAKELEASKCIVDGVLNSNINIVKKWVFTSVRIN